MGSGLEVNVPVFVNADKKLDFIAAHYTKFDFEPTIGQEKDMAVDSSADYRFSHFLSLIELLDKITSKKSVMIVNHGLSDPQDNPIGLSLPLSSKSGDWKFTSDIIKILADFASTSNQSNIDYNEIEKSRTKAGKHIPVNLLKDIDDILRSIRAKKLIDRIEIRACNIGADQTILSQIKTIFAARIVIAPKVHMFYGTVRNIRKSSQNVFNQWLRTHPGSRSFTDSATSNMFAMKMTGKSVARGLEYIVTSIDVKWFVEKYIIQGSGYISNQDKAGAEIAPFTFSAMDATGGSYWLTSESGYINSLVSV